MKSDAVQLMNTQTPSDSETAASIEYHEALRVRFRNVRRHSTKICDLLNPEDCMIQSMPDASPIRWHLAHTTWFFETFVLKQIAGYRHHDDSFEYLFNSYYNTVGDQFPRSQRGLLSRPTLAEILSYREYVDDRILNAMSDSERFDHALLSVLELGLQHEQQHQELMFTDIKHAFWCNPLYPAMQPLELPTASVPEQRWIAVDDGIYQVGHSGGQFSFDNESPQHRVFVEPFELSNRLITNGEYQAFVDDGGYQESAHWLSLGWQHVCEQHWTAPIYWTWHDGQLCEFTLAGLKPFNPDLPVSHLSYFEADAYARWCGNRLATEYEWEIACERFREPACTPELRVSQGVVVHPTHDAAWEERDQSARSSACPSDFFGMFGSLWQWTSSSYCPYPGYRPPDGALGEYNGKFMCNQYVLRGSSCATSARHARLSYRNFFAPSARWQFSGIRLARS
ncbi:MAG: ergothioneine biosynthesis protein EgtB [Pirellulaceae bacterium]|nr:ergothioneine biosynthesis protein EgtB [Pirellulaceae bacterium]